MTLAVDGDSRLSKALALHDDVLDYVISLNPHDFNRLRNPLMRRLMPPRITLRRIARMGATPLAELLLRIHEAAHLSLTDADRACLDAIQEEPLAANPESTPQWTRDEPARIIDLLEGDERLDADPMHPISVAVKAAAPGEVLLLKHKWEPQPLYDIWIKTGVEHFAWQLGPEEWWIYLRKRPR